MTSIIMRILKRLCCIAIIANSFIFATIFSANSVVLTENGVMQAQPNRTVHSKHATLHSSKPLFTDNSEFAVTTIDRTSFGSRNVIFEASFFRGKYNWVPQLLFHLRKSTGLLRTFETDGFSNILFLQPPSFNVNPDSDDNSILVQATHNQSGFTYYFLLKVDRITGASKAEMKAGTNSFSLYSINISLRKALPREKLPINLEDLSNLTDRTSEITSVYAGPFELNQRQQDIVPKNAKYRNVQSGPFVRNLDDDPNFFEQMIAEAEAQIDGNQKSVPKDPRIGQLHDKLVRLFCQVTRNSTQFKALNSGAGTMIRAFIDNGACKIQFFAGANFRVYVNDIVISNCSGRRCAYKGVMYCTWEGLAMAQNCNDIYGTKLNGFMYMNESGEISTVEPHR